MNSYDVESSTIYDIKEQHDQLWLFMILKHHMK